MNLSKLFEAQKKLGKVGLFNYQGEDRFNKLILALLVELGECANEWRGFKFWSKDQEPRTNEPFHSVSFEILTGESFPDVQYRNLLLEEYVDGFHFVLELGLEYEWTPVACDLYFKTDDVVKQFIGLYESISKFRITKTKDSYYKMLMIFIGLGEMLGFTWKQIETAYFEKHAINLKRQENGY